MKETTGAILALLLVQTGCAAETDVEVDPVLPYCVCVGDVPGGEINLLCGEAECIGGHGYRCVGLNTAEESPGVCGPTVGDLCDAIGPATCNRNAACQPGYNVDECIRQVRPACCENEGTCADSAGITHEELTRCANAFSSQPCNQLGTIPQTCIDILQ